MNHFLLSLLLRDIAPRLGQCRIEGIRMLNPILSVALKGDPESRCLVVLLSAPGPFLFTTSRDPLDGLGDRVLKRIAGARLGEVPPASGDRVVRLPLSGAHGGTSVSVYLFGHMAKVRIEREGSVIESLDPRESGRSPEPIASPAVPFVAVTAAQLMEEIRAGTSLPKAIPGLAPELIDCFLDPGGRPDPKALLRFRDDVLAHTAPFVLAARRNIAGVVPLPVAGTSALDAESLPHRFGPFPRAAEACESVGAAMLRDAEDRILDRRAAPIRKRLQRRGQLLVNLQHDLEVAATHEVGRQEAETLAAFQSQISQGTSRIELPSLYRPGETVRIDLDPAVSVQEEIRRRFKRAAKLERSRRRLGERIESVEKEIALLETVISGLEGDAEFGPLLRRLEEVSSRFRLLNQKRLRGQGREVRRYREFNLDPQWFAIVGRSNKENDEITFALAGPQDIWLHAHQVPGSHVVLKSKGTPGNPPDRILEAAAGIAAYFSKARHSSLVPVIYTLRKYVRKPRASKPGLVMCEREKTLFVKPQLPPSGHRTGPADPGGDPSEPWEA
jgi:hypothetical protein